MILLADANVLIDLGCVGGLSVLSQLGQAKVLSTVLLECEDDRQPDLTAQIAAAGIVTVEVVKTLIEGAIDYGEIDDELSLQDRQCLIYARDQGHVLITGDSRLRTAAGRENVQVHGSMWLVEQAYDQSLVETAELCRWLTQWPLQRRRLPHTELARLRQLLGC